MGLPLMLDEKLRAITPAPTPSARVRIALRTKELLLARRKDPQKYKDGGHESTSFARKKYGDLFQDKFLLSKRKTPLLNQKIRRTFPAILQYGTTIITKGKHGLREKRRERQR